MSDINVVDLLIKQGVDWTYRATWFGTDGEPVDLTGWTGDVQIRSSAMSTTVILEAHTSDNTMTLSDIGVVEFTFTHVQLSDLTFSPNTSVVVIEGVAYLKIGVYDVRLTDTDDVVMSFTQGDVYLAPEVTQ